jgi:hypothetical protein
MDEPCLKIYYITNIFANTKKIITIVPALNQGQITWASGGQSRSYFITPLRNSLLFIVTNDSFWKMGNSLMQRNSYIKN